MTGLEFAAAIVHSLAWPAVIAIAVVLLRRELAGTFSRLQTLKFPGGMAKFGNLDNYEKMIAAATKGESSSNDEAIARQGETEFSVLEALAAAAPKQAIVDAWGLLEYQLNIASDRVAPDQSHGWPQVARNLEAWDKWPILYPVVLELRRLRDYTVGSPRPPSSADAARYVSLTQDLVTTLRTSLTSQPNGDPGGDL